MRRFYIIFGAICALILTGPLLPDRAAPPLIKSGATTSVVPVMVTDASGNPATGLGAAFTVTVCKPGATAYITGFGTVSEVGNGVYYYVPTSTETAQAASKNILLVHLVSTAAATSFGDASAQIIAFDPQDSAALGLASIQAIRATTDQFNFDSNSNVNANANDWAGVLITSSVPTPISFWTYSSRTLTAQADPPGTTTLLARIPGTVQPQSGDAYVRLGAPTGASIADDVQTRLAGSAYVDPWGVTLPGSYGAGTAGYILANTPSATLAAYQNATTVGTLTQRVKDAIVTAILGGCYINGAINPLTHIGITTYYMPGTTLAAMNAGTATVIDTATVQYAADNRTLLSRVDTPGTF